MLWTRTTKLIVAPIYLILISNGLINSLYFYLDAGAQRCFIEDLPLDTIVNGKYKGEEYDNTKHIYHVNPQLGVQITVTVQSSFKPQSIGEFKKKRIPYIYMLT
ncbi:emp24p/erv25p- protein [Puccinia graminis f. sp. tritici]|uniref:Emp24p/erv25p-protein n=1 Tax=Puccinia graminis f. sp. tritici TaxID=56615 RepID=A0A5B0NBP6_PUCGR|nr:emp24p/erv25p- protein [Puccinia graminis f. sp. tritici]